LIGVDFEDDDAFVFVVVDDFPEEERPGVFMVAIAKEEASRLLLGVPVAIIPCRSCSPSTCVDRDSDDE